MTSATSPKRREGRPNRVIPLKRLKCSKYIHLLAQARLTYAKINYTGRLVLTLTEQLTKDVEDFLTTYQTPATIITEVKEYFCKQKFSYQGKNKQQHNSWLTIEEPTAKKLEELAKEINKQKLAVGLDIPPTGLSSTTLLSAIINYQALRKE